MNVWLMAIVGSAGVAGFFWLNPTLGWVVEIVATAWRRWRERGPRGTLARYFPPVASGADAQTAAGRQARSTLWALLALGLPIAAGLAGAVLARDWLLSPYVVGLGLVVGVFLRRQSLAARGAENTDDVEHLVTMFRSIFAAQESLSVALSETVGELSPGRVQTAVQQVLSMFRVRQNIDEATRPLLALGNPYITQFVFILTRLDTSDRETSLAALGELEERLRSRRRLRDRARTALVVLRLTVRTIQGGLLAAMLAVLVLPLWRSFYLGTLAHRVTFVVMTLLAMAASLFFDNETQRLEDQVL